VLFPNKKIFIKKYFFSRSYGIMSSFNMTLLRSVVLPVQLCWFNLVDHDNSQKSHVIFLVVSRNTKGHWSPIESTQKLTSSLCMENKVSEFPIFTLPCDYVSYHEFSPHQQSILKTQQHIRISGSSNSFPWKFNKIAISCGKY